MQEGVEALVRDVELAQGADAADTLLASARTLGADGLMVGRAAPGAAGALACPAGFSGVARSKLASHVINLVTLTSCSQSTLFMKKSGNKFGRNCITGPAITKRLSCYCIF